MEELSRIVVQWRRLGYPVRSLDSFEIHTKSRILKLLNRRNRLKTAVISVATVSADGAFTQTLAKKGAERELNVIQAYRKAYARAEPLWLSVRDTTGLVGFES